MVANLHLAMLDCELRQVRKEAAVMIDACARGRGLAASLNSILIGRT